MAKSKVWAELSLKDELQGVEEPELGSSLFVSLHTGDPGGGDSQAAEECSYGGYRRVSVERSLSGWRVVGNEASLGKMLVFPICMSGDVKATHFGLGRDAEGDGLLMRSGQLRYPLAISQGIRPEFEPGALVIIEG